MATETSVGEEMTHFYHGDTSKKACEALLLSNGGKNITGKFLFRKSKLAEYVLSVIYKGKVTHHMITKEKKGGGTSETWLINGSDSGTHSLAELASYLSQTRGKKWPLALTEGVPGLPVTPRTNALISTANADVNPADAIAAAAAAAEVCLTSIRQNIVELSFHSDVNFIFCCLSMCICH